MLRAIIFLFLFAGLGLSQKPVETARAYRQAHEVELLQRYAELLRIPNVAADAANLQRNADYVAAEFAKRGVKTELLASAAAPPLIFGQLNVPGATRTLGIYAHYDGQPVNPSEWVQSPWAPTLWTARHDEGGHTIELPPPGSRVDPEWRLYARSAADDKSQIFAMLTILDAFVENGIHPTSNFRFLFDGEEERGSPHLGAYLEAHRDKFADVDLWLFCDGPVHQSRRPQLFFGARGDTHLEVTVYGANRPLHSGHYGNWAPVPGMQLAQLLASMKDETGKVIIEEFYDSTAPIGVEERAALAKLPNFDDDLKAELGLSWTEGQGATLSERLMLPSLTVRGMSGGHTGAQATNIIPATASASLDLRLAKGNDPEHMLDLVERHIRQRGFHIVNEDPDSQTRAQYPQIAKVTRGSGFPAARTEMSLPIAKQVAAAVTQAAGQEVLLAPTMGGSLPLYLFPDLLGKPVLVLPISNHDNNQHAENENLRLANLWYGIDALAAVMAME